MKSQVFLVLFVRESLQKLNTRGREFPFYAVVAGPPVGTLTSLNLVSKTNLVTKIMSHLSIQCIFIGVIFQH